MVLVAMNHMQVTGFIFVYNHLIKKQLSEVPSHIVSTLRSQVLVWGEPAQAPERSQIPRPGISWATLAAPAWSTEVSQASYCPFDTKINRVIYRKIASFRMSY